MESKERFEYFCLNFTRAFVDSLNYLPGSKDISKEGDLIRKGMVQKFEINSREIAI